MRSRGLRPLTCHQGVQERHLAAGGPRAARIAQRIVHRLDCGQQHRLGRRRARRSYRRFCILLAGVLAPLIGQIGLGGPSEFGIAGSILSSGRVAIRNMIMAGYPVDHIFY